MTVFLAHLTTGKILNLFPVYGHIKGKSMNETIYIK